MMTLVLTGLVLLIAVTSTFAASASSAACPADGCIRSDSLLQREARPRTVALELSENSPSSNGWTVNPHAFSDTMSLTALVTIGGVDQTAGTLAAFLGTEVRGVQASPSLVPFGPYQGKSMYLIMIYGNDGDKGSSLSFKFKAADGSITSLEETRDFILNGNVGSVISPFALTAPAPPAPTPPPMPAPTPPPTPAPTLAPTPAASAWAVNPSDFSDTMTASALVTIGGVDQAAGTLAVFKGTDVRGVQDSPSLVPFGLYKGKHMFLITIYGNGGEKGLSFKFKAPSGSVTLLSQTLDFQANLNLGNVMAPYSLTAPGR